MPRCRAPPGITAWLGTPHAHARDCNNQRWQQRSHPPATPGSRHTPASLGRARARRSCKRSGLGTSGLDGDPCQPRGWLHGPLRACGARSRNAVEQAPRAGLESPGTPASERGCPRMHSGPQRWGQGWSSTRRPRHGRLPRAAPPDPEGRLSGAIGPGRRRHDGRRQHLHARAARVLAPSPRQEKAASRAACCLVQPRLAQWRVQEEKDDTTEVERHRRMHQLHMPVSLGCHRFQHGAHVPVIAWRPRWVPTGPVHRGQPCLLQRSLSTAPAPAPWLLTPGGHQGAQGRERGVAACSCSWPERRLGPAQQQASLAPSR